MTSKILTWVIRRINQTLTELGETVGRASWWWWWGNQVFRYRYVIFEVSIMHLIGNVKEAVGYKSLVGTSLVAQGTRVRALVQEDATCRRATKPVRHNYSACALEPASHNYWAHVPQLLKPKHLEPVLCNKGSHRNEKPAHGNEK